MYCNTIRLCWKVPVDQDLIGSPFDGLGILNSVFLMPRFKRDRYDKTFWQGIILLVILGVILEGC